MHIESAEADAVIRALPQLTALLIDNVDSGASIGWLPPMQAQQAEAYWRRRAEAVEAEACVLLLAWMRDTLAGSGQLGLEVRYPNGAHRAEVQKLIVHTACRRQGVATALMAALEDAALARGRTLLYLDTREGDPSEELYRKVGFQRAGAIPDYVINPDGSRVPTVLYYKILH